MIRDYAQHGRRHAANGTDPIPGGNGIEWALVGGHVAVNAPGTQTYVDLTGFAAYQGNTDSGLYTLQLGTASLGSIHGVKFSEPGVYRGSWVFSFPLFTSGDKVRGNYAGEGGVSASWAFSNNYSGQDDTITLGADADGTDRTKVEFARLIFAGTAAAIFPSVEAAGTASSNFSCDMRLLLERMSIGYEGAPV